MEHAAALALSKYIAERLRLPIQTGTDADLSAPLQVVGRRIASAAPPTLVEPLINAYPTD
jgi:hypothetical protein